MSFLLYSDCMHDFEFDIFMKTYNYSYELLKIDYKHIALIYFKYKFKLWHRNVK